jgi:16S rRNA (cytidine1402-2'-O)-methyltransferase
MKLILIPCPIAENTASTVLAPEVPKYIAECKHFLVENVRTARRFISELKLGISIESLTFEILDKDTPKKTVLDFFAKHQNEAYIGVISEAGCPGVADPGALAVGVAQTLNIEVLPLVGPSSILLALMGSGFSGQNFAFHGYLPIEKPARIKRMEQLVQLTAKTGETHIFIETPYRNNGLLEDMIQHLPPNTLLAIGANLQGEGGFIQTKTLKDWSAQKPELHKIPCIFLFGQTNN